MRHTKQQCDPSMAQDEFQANALKALDKLPVWKQYYNDAIAALKKEDNSRRIDRNTTVQEP